jgi:hypothetical protein
MWARFIWLRIGTSGGSCEHGNEPSGSIKFLEIPEKLVASQEGLITMEFVGYPYRLQLWLLTCVTTEEQASIFNLV